MSATQQPADITDMADPTRTGLEPETLRQAVLDNLVCLQGRFPDIADAARLVHGARLHACATGCWSAGSARCEPMRPQDVKVVCYLSAEFLIGPQLGNNLMATRHRGDRARGDGGARPGPRRADRARGGAGARQRRARPAGRLLPRLAGDAARCRRSATASATSSASSTRRSATARRSRSPTSGCRRATPGRSRARTRASTSASAATPRASPTTRGRYRVRWVPAQPGQGRALRHAGARLPRQHLQHPAAVEERGGGVLRLPRLQRRRLLRRGAGEGALGDALQGALPERRAGDRPAPAPRAAVLLRLLLAAGHAAPARPPGRADRPGCRRSAPPR